MSGVEIALVAAFAGLKAKATLDAGKAQANMYNAQARQTELQGRVQAIEYQTEANNALSNLEKVLAANNARASAGNMDPLASGSSHDLIARLNMREGVNQFTIARDNATMAKQMAAYQAGQYRTAASNAKKMAQTQALIGIGETAMGGMQIFGTPDFLKTTKTG